MYFPRAICISAKMRRLKTGPGIGGSQAEAITLSSCTRAGFSSCRRELIFFRIGLQAAFRVPLAVSSRVSPACRRFTDNPGIERISMFLLAHLSAPQWNFIHLLERHSTEVSLLEHLAHSFFQESFFSHTFLFLIGC